MYLTLQDFYLKIQDQNLQQIISEEDKYRVKAQAEALIEIKSYLSQKFDIEDEFRDTVQFSFTETYSAKQLVYLDAEDYDSAATYSANDLALSNGKVYFSISGNSPEAFNGAQWTELGDQYDYFYVTIPYEEFDHEGAYEVDDVVFWDNKVYTCLRDTLPLSQATKLQYGETFSAPGPNQYPDASGQSQWSEGVSYSFSGIMPTSNSFTAWDDATAYTAGQKVSYNSKIYVATGSSTDIEPGTDITKWVEASFTEGDNRNPMLVGMNVVMAIHKLSPRISPFNVPDVWVKNYDDAISWLKKCAKGEVTLDMPMRQPDKKRIRWGSTVRNINNY